MINQFQNIPSHMIYDGIKSDIFFTKNLKLKYNTNVNSINLKEQLKIYIDFQQAENIEHNTVQKNECLEHLCEYLHNVLNVDFYKRYSADQCLTKLIDFKNKFMLNYQ
jgi:hypothetical protein